MSFSTWSDHVTIFLCFSFCHLSVPICQFLCVNPRMSLAMCCIHLSLSLRVCVFFLLQVSPSLLSLVGLYLSKASSLYLYPSLHLHLHVFCVAVFVSP